MYHHKEKMSDKVDFSLLNALAAEIGEQRLLEMAKAYVVYVEEKRSGIPPMFTWGGEVEPRGDSPLFRPIDSFPLKLMSPRTYSPNDEIIHSPRFNSLADVPSSTNLLSFDT